MTRMLAPERYSGLIPHHSGPFRGFLGKEPSEARGRILEHSAAQVRDSHLHLRIVEQCVHVHVKLVDDVGWGIPGRANALESARLIARNEIAYGEQRSLVQTFLIHRYFSIL